MCDPTSVKKLSKRMKRVVAQAIYVTKGGKCEVFQRPRDTSAPKTIKIWHREAGSLHIPKTEMKLDGQRHLGIECVSAPGPILIAKHRWQMVGTTEVPRLIRMVANRR